MGPRFLTVFILAGFASLQVGSGLNSVTAKQIEVREELPRAQKVDEMEQESSESASANNRNWPSFLGPDQNGISSVTEIRTDWSEGKLPVLWTREVGEGYAPGVYVDGNYFHTDRVEDQTRVFCIDGGGETVWEFTHACGYRDLYGYDGGPRSCPVVDGDEVFVYSVDGILFVLDRATGDKKWMLDLNDKFHVHQNFFGVGSAPVIFEDKILLCVGGSPKENEIRAGQLDQAKPNETGIVALDRKTGDVVYSIGNDLASYSTIKLAKRGERTWAFAWLRSGLLAFDAASGETLFEFPWRARVLESVNAATPVVFGNQVFLSECYGVGSVLIEFGDELENKHRVVWKDAGRDKKMMTHWNTCVYDQEFLFGSSGRNTNNAELRCIRATTGEVMWSEPKLKRCNASWVDGHLAVVGEYGKVFLIKATSEGYEKITEFEPKPDNPDGVSLKFPCWAAPVIADGKMFVRGKDQVVCFELAK